MSPSIPTTFPPTFRCEAATHAIDAGNYLHDVCEVCGACGTAGDPATLIGLALSFSRQGPTLGVQVPQFILGRLAIHARHGNAACRMVLDFLFRRSRTVAVESAVRPDAVMLERQRVSKPGRRRAQPDRVLSALASVPSVEPTGANCDLKRRRREPLAEIVSARSSDTDGETSHG
jgi:hypothetical protein